MLLPRITPGLLARQLGLVVRTIIDLARRPARGKDFLRMAGSMRRSTVDHRLPWLPFALIDDLALKVGPGTRVFEYGGGGSTLWFVDRDAELATAEHDAEWAEVLALTVGSRSSWSMDQRSLATDYVSAIERFPDEHFDVVLIDGRRRVECFSRAIGKVRPGGWLILDDTERRRYRPAFALVPWPRETYVGFAPCKPTFAYTTVFRRPEGLA